jgi:Mrp family chromosome partitioning ATPase
LTTAQDELRDRKNAYQRTSDSSRISILENARDAMREKIYDLQIQESDLRSRYTDDYPLLQEIRRQREAAERLLIDMPAGEDRPTTFTATSGTSDVQLVHATAAPAAHDVQRLEAAPRKSKLESELQKINDQEYELGQLEREVALLEGKYKMHVEKLEQARVNDELGRENIRNVKVAQPATLVHKPVAPMKAVILGLGALLACFGSIGLAFVSESVDQTLRTTDQVEAQLGLPVLASLPYRKRRRRRRRKAANHEQGAPHTSHAGYQAMLRALGGTSDSGRRCAKTVGVVGCETAKSRSRVAGNLAIQAASCGADPVLLIDADARRRRVSKRFHLNGSPGWCEIMKGNAIAKTCVQPSKLGNLALLGPGGAKASPLESSQAIETRGPLDDLKGDFGLVVIDLPPAGELNGATVANLVDEVVLVVEAERTRIQAAQRARDLLTRAGIRVAGVVLANRREHIPRWLYQRL